MPWNAVAASRVALYRNGWLKTQRLPLPVISVGALEMGGTGKTPATIAVASMLREHGIRAAVLSRGYARTGNQPTLVGVGAGPIENATVSGDEPWLMSHLLPDVPVAVAARREGAARLVPDGSADVFVLDDGFQHVRVHRQLDLLVVDPAAPFWEQSPPPLGRLREGTAAACRADAFLLRGEARTALPDAFSAQPRFNLHQLPTRFVPLSTWIANPDSAGVDAPTESCAAFAGIARPRRFVDDLRELGLRVDFAQQYRDHQTFTATEIRGLAEGCRLRECATLVTTEKDAARLAHLDLDDVNILVATHRMEFDDPTPFLEAVADARVRHTS